MAIPPRNKPVLPPAPRLRDFRETLLAFYGTRARALPWRSDPTPYAVWVSEMMLQQTQVATVLPYYERWMKRFPTLQALANAPEADVLAQWQGLGYYARARALQAGAQRVLAVHDGQLPTNVQALQALPGIGPYTAGAIASIAFQQRAAIVDGNVIRVLCRVFGLVGSPSHQPLKSFLWSLAEALVPHDRPRDFNQALMEFGALCCTPKKPLCHQCPAQPQCFAFKTQQVDRLPELPARKAVTKLVNVAALVKRGDRVLIGQRPSSAARWPSMWQFPNVDLNSQETPQAGVVRALNEWFGVRSACGEPLLSLQHSVTRYRITLRLFASSVSGAPKPLACQAARWLPLEELPTLAMPAAHQKLAALLLRPQT